MPLDTQKSEAFAGRLIGALNEGALCLMTAIGHRTGLFDAMRDAPPMTSAELAERAGLDERYVREWLGAMVTARVVEIDPSTRACTLPPEHAAFLTRAAGADNMAVFAQYISVLAGVEEDVIECFRKGGGVPYSRYPRFQAVMAEDSGQSVLSSLQSHILPLVPDLADRLTRGARMLDVGCGSGRVIVRLAGIYPNSRFTGIDLSDEAIASGREAADEAGLTNVTFISADLSDFDERAEPSAYEFVTTFDAVHDQSRPLNVLRGIHRTLTDDGVYLMQEIKGTSHVERDGRYPLATLLYTISCMHCMTVSLAQGGEGLGAMWGEERAREYLTRAGFRSIEKHELAHDIQNDWYVVRK
jgi:ubiquinone/menaquinone biosynthesis C-methylase UbiE